MDIDIDEIARRGGQVYADANLAVVQCDKCAAQFLHDKDALILYPDPQNLGSQFVVSSPCPPCPQCGDPDWEFYECDETTVQIGDWAWVLA
jgi:hypothetical protein